MFLRFQGGSYLVKAKSGYPCALNVFTENGTYSYVDGVVQGENDLEKDFDILVEFDESTSTYNLNVYGDVVINNDGSSRGIFITDNSLSIYGNGTLTVNINGFNPATVFETKKIDPGKLTIGSDDTSQRLSINVICNSDCTEGNPHNFRVFRTNDLCLIQNCNIYLEGANTFSEGGGNTIKIYNSSIVDNIILTDFGPDDNGMSFITGKSVEIYDSNVLLTCKNQIDFNPANYVEGMSLCFDKSFILDNTNFIVYAPFYNFARESEVIDIRNGSSLNVSTYMDAFYRNYMKTDNTSFNVSNSSLIVQSVNGYCIKDNKDINISLNENNVIDLYSTSADTALYFNNNEKNPSINIIHPYFDISTSYQEAPSIVYTDEINWNYDDISTNKLFNKLFTGNHKVQIKYDANGGKPLLQTTIIDKDLPASVIQSPSIVKRNGYTFMGWGAMNSNGTLSDPVLNDSNIYSDTVLHAIWKCNHDDVETYKVKLPTLTEPGSREYYKCKTCGKYYYFDQNNSVVYIDNISEWLKEGSDGYVYPFENNSSYDFYGPKSLEPTSSFDRNLFVSNADISKFVCLLIGTKDNILKAKLVSNEYYDYYEGSTKIVLHNDYLCRMKPGTYYMYIVSTDGYASGTFKILSNNNEEKHVVPNTGIYK